MDSIGSTDRSVAAFKKAKHVTRYPCPIPGCPRSARTLNGLFTHLYRDHIKKDLITWILNRTQKERYAEGT